MDAEAIREMFSEFGPVTVRRMFGGAGISADGINFAIAFDGVIYLKIDETTKPDFEREGSAPFVYTRYKDTKRAARASLHYWRLPERLYDDPEELAAWASRALAVAQRAKAVKRARSPRGPRTARGAKTSSPVKPGRRRRSP